VRAARGSMPPILLRVAGLVCLCLAAFSSARAQDGIYADFVTSQGSFTCQLHFDRAPRTVANFIGLATGERRWLDPQTGEAARRPFFHGLTFHRVVGGVNPFVIQGGSPTGESTGGPGFTFRDEFDATLRHNRAGILSMANNGMQAHPGPHANGSQFFVTLSARPELDNVHTVFGEVTSGMNVVTAIGNVAVDGSSRPLTPVVIQSVAIRRIGAAANAFNIAGQPLPAVGGAGPKLARNGAAFSLQFPRAASSDYWLFHSANLATWSGRRIGLYATAPLPGDLDVTTTAAGQAKQFYRVAQIAYPGPLYTRASVAGATISMQLTNGDNLLLTLNQAGGGVTNYNGVLGVITQATWLQEAYRGQLSCYSNLPPLVIGYDFTSATGGTFKGTAYTSPSPTAIAGTFTITP
jgi:peptidyl-prolyl cis-trans isomerase A (cyclophilin A)